MSGLRDALAAKQVLTTYYDIPMQPRPVVDEIVGRLNDARQKAYVLTGAGKTRAEKESAKVKAELDACFHRVQFRGLHGDDEMDALINKHPPKDADVEKAKADGVEPPVFDWNEASLALVAECAIDSDLTVDEWRTQLWSDRWTAPDRMAFFNQAWMASRVEFNAGIPKE